jgi:hypothetical protein
VFGSAEQRLLVRPAEPAGAPKAHPELLELSAAAEKLLAATGDAVTRGPTYGGDQTR